MGRAGGSLPTKDCLGFAADHADARDAVYSELDVPALERALECPVLLLQSRAAERAVYLQRPDLGRRLESASAAMFGDKTRTGVDLALIVADGLSAVAAQRHAADVVRHLLALITTAGFTVGPLCVVKQARVAIADEIGSLLHARISIILIGERPGLGFADSLGAYLTYQPTVGKTDADRNCVSNINPRCLPPAAAAATLFWLTEQALRRQLSGVHLKDESMRTRSVPTNPHNPHPSQTLL
jgi:ethanolamine ammonia-lyase small subunit